MQQMRKEVDGTWSSVASSPPLEIHTDLPDNIRIGNEVDIKPRRKSRERKAKS